MKRIGSSEKILYLLKTRGVLTATNVAQLMDMTMMGARQLLINLETDKLIKSFEQKKGRGRPKLYWQLSNLGHARFPDRHSDLTLHMIDSVKSVFGESGLERLISEREQEMLRQYRASLAQAKSLQKKLTLLVEIRNKEGYMAELVKDEQGGYLFIENHCPICSAASACQQFCRSELNIFESCLETKVERIDYILEGARRCAYRVG